MSGLMTACGTRLRAYATVQREASQQLDRNALVVGIMWGMSGLSACIQRTRKVQSLFNNHTSKRP
jgi:hypothetical protein